MNNIVKLYNNKKYKLIQKYILTNPELFNNQKYMYIRACTEYNLKLYEDSYISFKTLNKYNLNDDQKKINKDYIFKLLEKINNNKIKINYNNEYIILPKKFKWIIPGVLCYSLNKLISKHMKIIEYYDIKYIITKDIFNNNFNKLTVENTDYILNLINKCKINKEILLIDYSFDSKYINTILACYFIIADNNSPSLSYLDAIKKVKNIYNNTDVDEQFILEYSIILWNRYNKLV